VVVFDSPQHDETNDGHSEPRRKYQDLKDSKTLSTLSKQELGNLYQKQDVRASVKGRKQNKTVNIA
jgi:hypothetical protein